MRAVLTCRAAGAEGGVSTRQRGGGSGPQAGAHRSGNPALQSRGEPRHAPGRDFPGFVHEAGQELGGAEVDRAAHLGPEQHVPVALDGSPKAVSEISMSAWGVIGAGGEGGGGGEEKVLGARCERRREAPGTPERASEQRQCWPRCRGPRGCAAAGRARHEQGAAAGVVESQSRDRGAACAGGGGVENQGGRLLGSSSFGV